MRQLTYAGVLAFCALAVVPLELVLRAGVVRQWRRLVRAVACGAAPFLVWDAWAVHSGHWSFDDAQVIGPRIGSLPVEEIAFFAVIPVCAVLTLEAVRRVRGR